MEESDDLFDLVEAPPPVSPEKKKISKDKDGVSGGDKDVSRKEGSLGVDKRDLSKVEGSLGIHGKQQYLPKLGNPGSSLGTHGRQQCLPKLGNPGSSLGIHGRQQLLAKLGNPGSSLGIHERQQLLAKVGNPEGPRNVQKRIRERTIAAICVDGANPFTVLPKMRLVDPIGIRISQFIKTKSLVQVKLRNKNHFENPNRTIIGVIQAADQHWNLYMTDADEAYIPPSKLGVVQSYPDQMFGGTVYEKVANEKRVLQRSLKSTIVMGQNIVYISLIK